MRRMPFLETTKDNEREALLRRLAFALSPKSRFDQNLNSEQSLHAKPTPQE